MIWQRKLPQKKREVSCTILYNRTKRGEIGIFYKEMKDIALRCSVPENTGAHPHMNASCACKIHVQGTENCFSFKSLLFLFTQANLCLKHLRRFVNIGDGGADVCVIIRNLLDYISERSGETKSPYWRSRWTRDFSSARLSAQDVMYPQKYFRQPLQAPTPTLSDSSEFWRICVFLQSLEIL